MGRNVGFDRVLVTITVFVILIVAIWWYLVNRMYRAAVFNNKPLGMKVKVHTGDKRRGLDMRIKSGDGFVHARWYDDFPGKRTVVFCHGNVGTIADRGYMVEITQVIGVNLVLFDYRGYGRSEGTMNERTIMDDTLNVYEYAVGVAGKENIILWGESLGGAVSMFAAVYGSCSRLILMSTFSSLHDVLKHSNVSNSVKRLVGPVFIDSVKSMPASKWARELCCPVIVIHSKDDTVVHPKNAEMLYEAIGSVSKELLYVTGAHATPRLSNDDFKVLAKFIFADNGEDYTLRTSDAERLGSIIAEYEDLYKNEEQNVIDDIAERFFEDS